VNSLRAHLTAGSDHGRLHFHSDCPVCRNQRVDGARSDAVLPARAQAGLLAAALGAGTLLPGPVATASSPGEHPTAKPSQAPTSPPGPPESAPMSAPEEPLLGTDETQEAPVDEAPQVRELLINPEVGTDTGGEDASGDGEDSPPAPPPLGEAPAEPAPVEPTPAPLGQPPAPAPPVEPPPAPPQPAPTPMPQPPLAPAETPPAAELDQLATPHPAGPRVKPEVPERRTQPRRPSAQPIAQSEAVPQRESAPLPVEAVVPPSTTTASIAQQPEPSNGPITGDSYTVRPGDSLWSIARRLLGPEASAGRIAREVNRLWELNHDRIGTGDASLIYAGTVLRLP
jgi:LysM domain